MLATLIKAPFNDKGWVFETKWDGFRLIAIVEQGRVRLYSRNGTDVTPRYPTIAKALSRVRGSAVMDGELVALDPKGVSRFQLLQNALNTNVRLVYCVFDLLSAGGKDMRKRPLLERKALLESILPSSPLLRYSTHTPQTGKVLFAKAKRAGFEGIVAKRAAGLYYSGKRTREWLKIKTGLRQEVVVVGYTAPRRSRKHFGALVLAVREHRRWKYVGRVGTGFDASSLMRIHGMLKKIQTKKKPVRETVPDELHTTWVHPRIVGEVTFTEWTARGEMRHPAFVGLREDKPARAVVRETAS